MRKSKIYEFSKDELQSILDDSHSKREVLDKLGLKMKSGNHQTLNRIIEEYNLSTEKLEKNKKIHLQENARASVKKALIDFSEILIENSTYTNRRCLKSRLVKAGLLKYECSECGNKGEWNGKPLALALDHINGINNDNRIENLRLLCPNCHSQTDTFGGKNIK